MTATLITLATLTAGLAIGWAIARHDTPLEDA